MKKINIVCLLLFLLISTKDSFAFLGWGACDISSEDPHQDICVSFQLKFPWSVMPIVSPSVDSAEKESCQKAGGKWQALCWTNSVPSCSETITEGDMKLYQTTYFKKLSNEEVKAECEQREGKFNEAYIHSML